MKPKPKPKPGPEKVSVKKTPRRKFPVAPFLEGLLRVLGSAFLSLSMGAIPAMLAWSMTVGISPVDGDGEHVWVFLGAIILGVLVGFPHVKAGHDNTNTFPFQIASRAALLGVTIGVWQRIFYTTLGPPVTGISRLLWICWGAYLTLIMTMIVIEAIRNLRPLPIWKSGGRESIYRQGIAWTVYMTLVANVLFIGGYMQGEKTLLLTRDGGRIDAAYNTTRWFGLVQEYETSMDGVREYERKPMEGVLLKSARSEFKIDGDVARPWTIPCQFPDRYKLFKLAEHQASTTIVERTGPAWWALILISGAIFLFGLLFDRDVKSRADGKAEISREGESL